MSPQRKVERRIFYQYPPRVQFIFMPSIANYYYYYYSFCIESNLLVLQGVYIKLNDVHVVMIQILRIFSQDYRLLNLHPIFHKYLYWQYKVYAANK